MNLAFCVETLMEGAGITNRDLYRSKVFKKRGHRADMFAFAVRKPIPPIDYKLVFGSSFSSKIFRRVSFLAKNRIKETFADYDYIFITSNTNLMRFFDQPGIREKTVVTYSGFAHPYLRLYHGEKLFNRERMCEEFFEMAPRFPHLFANSDYTQKELELGGIDHAKRVYNGIDLEIFYKDEKIKKSEKPLFLYTGRILEHKTNLLLLRMYKEVEEALGGNCELVQVGQQSGKYFQRCLAYEKNLGLKTSRYVDLLRHGELNQLYNQAWLFVTSAFFETFSNSHMEAAACGLPTLSWHIGSLPEVVKHKETGLLIRPINEKQFVDSWIDLAENDEKRNKMSDAGPAWSENFTWDKICDSISQHLDFPK